jgi:hypothetical protein
MIKNGAAALGSVGVEVDLVFSPPILLCPRRKSFFKSVLST